jgi:tRNA (guanine-N7-)-methyltransferase
MEQHDHPQKLYGRRKGPKPSARQILLRERLLPDLALDPKAGRDPKTYFITPIDEVWLEIGFGAGEHLLTQARANPTVGMIGAEAYQSGTDKLLSKLDSEFSSPVYGGGDRTAVEGGINIRLYEGDGRDILRALPDASLGRFFLLFPDPWPKTRHHKRRFVQMALLDELARVLKPGGEVRIASDDAGYVAWSLERLMAHPAFAWTAQGPQDWKTRPAGWPPTRYEKKALHGPPAFLSFVRTGS